MISNQILQNTIDGLKGITRIDLCIIDTEGKVLATTFQDTDNYVTAALAFVESPADSQVFWDVSFLKYLTTINWNISCWLTETVKMYIW